MSSKRKSHRAKKRSEKRKAAAEVAREFIEASTGKASDSSAREVFEANARQAEAIARQAEATVPEDERSVPPAGDLATGFFSLGPPSWPAPHVVVEEDPFALDARDKRARSLAPQAIARRALFARYVRVAVGVSVLLCVAAVVKSALTRDDYAPPNRSARSAASAGAAPSSDLPPPVAAETRDPVASQLALAPEGKGAVDAGDGGEPPVGPAMGAGQDPGAAGTLRVR
jgi:hypothetical protein